MACYGLGKNEDHRERNWTDFEVELFCSIILSDPEYKYALTLESKAFKKQENKEVYEGLQSHFQVALVEAWIVNSELYNDVEGKPLDIEIPIKKC